MNSRHGIIVLTVLATLLASAVGQGIFGGQLPPSRPGRPQSITGIINLLRYQNQPCEGRNNQNGTCVSEQDCIDRKGTEVNRCANGFGVCCYVSFTCGKSTSDNETEFVNPNYPNGENGTDTCQVTIEKQNNVCQLRLDFLEFSLAQPDENGQCITDSFMVRTTVGERLPILCGENAGLHLYVDMGRSSGNPVVLSVVSNGDKMTRRWRIKISMVQCNSLDIAPAGCLLYYRSPSAIVRSFNYGPMVEHRVRYLSNLRYSICIRMEENYCSIKWETESNSSFSWGKPIDRGANGTVCNMDDFVGIDQGSTLGLGPGQDRFCGTSLGEENVIISNNKPFTLKVKSNHASSDNAANGQYGFSLRYTQLPCVV
ncbi:hypothetical protein MRX96_022862 [Rhipicephalus microplus]